MVQVLAGRAGRFWVIGAAILLSANSIAKAQSLPTQAPHAGESAAEHAAHSEPVDEKNESNLDYLWRKSDEAFHAGDFPRAIQLHRAIIALDPQDTQSFGVGAWLLWSLGEKDEATGFIARGLKANPDNWEMWDEAAQHYDLQKMLPESLNAHRQAVAHFPKDVPIAEAQMLRRRLAHSAEHAGDFALSAQTWRDLVRDFPDEAVNKNNLARVEALVVEKSQQANNSLAYLPLLAVGAIFVFGSRVVVQRSIEL